MDETIKRLSQAVDFMKCEEAQNLLADYSVNGLDGALRVGGSSSPETIDKETSRKTSRQLEAHLKACSHCAYELELLWRVVSFVEGASQKHPPPGLWEGIESHIRRNSEKMEREVGTKR